MQKRCFKCNEIKSLDQFYKHNRMKDGHLNKCIECTKMDSLSRYTFLTSDARWMEAERKRARLKGQKHKYNKPGKKLYQQTYKLKFPEKRTRPRTCAPKGFHAHHWSYNPEHRKDTIVLSVKDHAFIHRFLTYANDEMMYKTKDGILLNTKAKHEEYISTLLLIEDKQ